MKCLFSLGDITETHNHITVELKNKAVIRNVFLYSQIED